MSEESEHELRMRLHESERPHHDSRECNEKIEALEARIRELEGSHHRHDPEEYEEIEDAS